MTASEILHDERIKWGEWLELLPPDQQNAFLVAVLANSLQKQNLMIEYLKSRLEKYQNGKD